MRSSPLPSTGSTRPARPAPILAGALVLFGLASAVSAQQALVSFFKLFDPDTIGPGSVTTLTFVIDSSEDVAVTDLAFTDTLPAGVTIASPSNTSTTCGAGAFVSAPESGSTISLTGGELPPTPMGEEAISCEVTVDVTSATPGVHTNVSGDLTSSLGNHGDAVADLTVTGDRPGFTKDFSPDPIFVGQTSTLTFTIDNTANASPALGLDFTDVLPFGLVVADPANVSTTCGPAILTAAPGSDTVDMILGSVSAGSSCTVTLEVLANVAGSLGNTTSNLSSSLGSSGKAADVLDVQLDSLVKAFTDDPVPPGGTVTLEFTLTNFDRTEAATDLAFTDDLDATLTGLESVSGTLTDVCGAGSEISGTSTLSFTGGSLPAGGSCTFSVTLQVPAGTTPGTFPNTTSPLTATLGGESVTLNAASDDLVVAAVPVLTKEFTDDPVAPGDTVTLEFTITNTNATSGATDVAFTDDLDATLPGLVGSGLPLPDVCGPGSELAAFDPPGPAPPDPSLLSFTGGSLAAAGQPGDSCTFQVTLQVPSDASGGPYTNSTSTVTATVDGETVTGDPATDDLVVVEAPPLLKEFTDDPVQPGDTVTLQFTLEHGAEATSDVTGITFTDDLAAALPGLAALPPFPTEPCGTGSALTGSSGETFLTLSGGTLAPGESCTFGVTLQVPAGAPSGNHLNTTSPVQATVDGIATESPAASDLLTVAVLNLTKEFLDDPVLPGATTTLRFTIQNLSPSSAATDVQLIDDLDAALSGLEAIGLPMAGCGGTVSGTSTIFLIGGSLGPGESCSFDVTLQVPAGAASDDYLNVATGFSATVEGETVLFPDATDALTVDDDLLVLAKEFLNDPVPPGGTVTLRFTIESLAADTASDIAFTDDLDAALSGLASTSGTLTNVCGAGSEIAGASTLTFTGGTLAAGASCTFDVTVQVPGTALLGASALNTTSEATGTVGGLGVTGAPATDTLEIDPLTFTKSFDGPTVAGGTAVLTFTLTNLDSGSGVAQLGFTDDLDAALSGLVAAAPLPTDPCGAGSSLSGTSLLTLTTGELAAAGEPGDSCTFGVTVEVPAGAAPGSFPNTTSELLSAGIPVADPATDSLEVEPPPAFGKVFAPDAVGVGGTSTLTFNVVNTASAVPASDLAFTDLLPAGVEVASPPNASTTCAGGTLTAVAGSGVISYSGGTVAAGASCAVRLDVIPTAPGAYLNTSSALISSSGTSGTASDTLEAVAQALTFGKAFEGAASQGGTVDLVFTLTSGFTEPVTGIAFTDDLDAVIPGMEAVGLPMPDVCGLGSEIAGTSVLSFTGGVLPPGGSCTFRVTLQLPPDLPPPPYENLTSPVTFDVGGAAVEGPAATAELRPSVLQIPTLGEWALALLASLLLAGGLWRLRT